MNFESTPWLDQIEISDIRLRCIIGLNPDERTKKQDVLINIILFADLSRASKSDLLQDSLDYKAIKNNIIQVVEESSFQLIERLAGRISEICLEKPLVQRAQVRVDKPGALRFARSVAVEITRTKAPRS